MPDGESVTSRTRNEGVIVVHCADFLVFAGSCRVSAFDILPPAEQGAGRKWASCTFGPQQERSLTITGSARAKRPAHPKRVQKGSAGQAHVTPGIRLNSGMTGYSFPIAIGEPLMTDLVADLDGEWSTIRLT